MCEYVCAQGKTLCFSGPALRNLCLEKMRGINDEGEKEKERVMSVKAVLLCVSVCAQPTMGSYYRL